MARDVSKDGEYIKTTEVHALRHENGKKKKITNKTKKQTKTEQNKQASKQIEEEKRNKQTNPTYFCLPLHGHLKKWESVIALFDLFRS